MHAFRRHPGLHQEIADRPRISHPGIGMAVVTIDFIKPAEPRHVGRRSLFRHPRQAGSAAHVGLHHAGFAFQDPAADLPPGPCVPAVGQRHVDLLQRIVFQRPGHRAVRPVDGRDRLAGLLQGADEPHVKLVRAAEFAAAENMDGMNGCRHREGISGWETSRSGRSPVAPDLTGPAIPPQAHFPANHIPSRMQSGCVSSAFIPTTCSPKWP